MQEKLYRERLEKRGLPQEQIEESLGFVRDMETYLSLQNDNLDFPSEEKLDAYMRKLVEERQNQLPHILALARYYYIIDNKKIYIYYTGILGGLNVMESILNRARRYCSEEQYENLIKNLVLPEIGTPIADIPKFTADFMEKLKQNVPEGLYQKVLSGNNHQLSKEALEGEKEAYQLAESLDAYLKDRHTRKIMELEQYLKENKVWFEQRITPAVIEYVRGNQEILSAVRKGNKLYITKIPYDTEEFLKAKTKEERLFYACHCSFVRKNFINKKEKIAKEWCYCSAGFAKFPFEVILDRELEVVLLESPLSGSDICRFEIDLGKEEGVKIEGDESF